MVDLNQDEREFEDNDVETNNLNSQDGEETTDEPITLSEYNEKIGKNFKSWDDVAKSQKQIDIDFAKGKVKKNKENYLVDALSVTEAEAKLVKKFVAEGVNLEYEVVKVSETKILEVF